MLAILVNLGTNVGEQFAVYLVSLVGTMQTSPELILQPVLQPVELSPLISKVLVAAAAARVSLLPKSGGKDRDRAGETDGDDANPGHPNRDTTPSGCLAFQCGKDAGD